MTGPGTVKASMHAGLRPALWSRVVFVALAAVTAAGLPPLPAGPAPMRPTSSSPPDSPNRRERTMPEIALPGNIEIITRFEHAFRAADQATIDELADPGLADHNPAPGHEPTLAGFKQKVAGFKAVFPDLVEDLQDIIASGDTVATRWVVTGSLQQELMGIPASGQAIRVEGMNFYRLKDGRVTDIWTQFDGVALMQQLGAITA
ncbi:MAG TPA: ester cyclase [Streptosporangiaceae bacterium]|jgi:steroid delta-isomerase-like uncharacterized protein|nr:ester cyclase [Streptosporangiaceae bacterium]